MRYATSHHGDGHACRTYYTGRVGPCASTAAVDPRGRPPLAHTPWPLPLDSSMTAPHASALDDPRLPPQVCNKFSAAAIAIKSPLVAVRPLMAAAAALQPGPTHFTPLHAEFLKAPPLYACTGTMHTCSWLLEACPHAQPCTPPPLPPRRLLSPTRPPPRPIIPGRSPLPTSLPPSLAHPPTHPPTGLHPRQDLHRRRADAATATAPGKLLPSFARPLPDPCHTHAIPRSRPGP